MTTAPSPFGGGGAVAASQVRTSLLRAGFTVEGVAERLGDVASAALGRGDYHAARRALRPAGAGEDPLAAVVRLLLLGEPVERRAVEPALPVDAAAALGLVAADGADDADLVRALLDLRPYGEPDADWYLVSDRTDGALAPDHVLGVGGASTTLARITPRLPVGRALDVGTGCGVQALHLSRHAGTVVVTDSNARALRLAALTAALSGTAWQARRGDLLAPVAGERFDLVVSNPPFVVSPRARFEYRDAGLTGDALGPRLVAALPPHLADGGLAVVLANWLHVHGEDWRERVASWVAATGCDAWVVQREVQDPAEYAALWLRDAGEDRSPAYAAAYDDWLDALAALGADAVGFGWIVLRAAGRTAPLVTVEDLAAAPRLPDGAEVLARLDGLAAADALLLPDLLDLRLAWAPGAARTETTVRLDGGAEGMLPARVGRLGGWLPDAALPGPVADVVGEAAGTGVPLRTVVDAVAARVGVDDLDLLAATLPAVRALVADGVLVPLPTP